MHLSASSDPELFELAKAICGVGGEVEVGIEVEVGVEVELPWTVMWTQDTGQQLGSSPRKLKMAEFRKWPIGAIYSSYNGQQLGSSPRVWFRMGLRGS